LSAREDDGSLVRQDRMGRTLRVPGARHAVQLSVQVCYYTVGGMQRSCDPVFCVRRIFQY
jgi:hypothetical protein